MEGEKEREKHRSGRRRVRREGKGGGEYGRRDEKGIWEEGQEGKTGERGRT